MKTNRAQIVEICTLFIYTCRLIYSLRFLQLVALLQNSLFGFCQICAVVQQQVYASQLMICCGMNAR